MIERPASIRIATEKDEPAVMALLRMLHNENAMASWSEAKVRNCVELGTRGKGGIVGVIDGPDGIVGSIGMSISEHYYSDDTHLQEMWNFVHPDHRRTDYAKDLINFGKWCSEKLGLVLTIAIMSTHRTEAKVRLYQRHFTYCGAFFRYGEPKFRNSSDVGELT